MSLKEWEIKFKEATKSVTELDINNTSYNDSAEQLRTLLKTGLLKHNDLIHKPERFFLAHRLLAEHSPHLGPGFWIRFTVHYNLCVGTILGLGNDEQIEALKVMQEKGLIIIIMNYLLFVCLFIYNFFTNSQSLIIYHKNSY